MMGVHAGTRRSGKVQELLNLKREPGCKLGIVSFDTLVDARLKTNSTVPDLAVELFSLEEVMKVYDDMEALNCQIWTSNAMISVYGQRARSSKAEQLLEELAANGFFPDAVTYRFLSYAFAREGKAKKVKEICEEMVKKWSRER
ncbi:hypothetical protein NL676_016242 [Syzygium grande]|nr:hypothetical protein NL676_016242 [Syzygium grande]